VMDADASMYTREVSERTNWAQSWCSTGIKSWDRLTFTHLQAQSDQDRPHEETTTSTVKDSKRKLPSSTVGAAPRRIKQQPRQLNGGVMLQYRPDKDLLVRR
jgi:hypothetical protein